MVEIEGHLKMAELYKRSVAAENQHSCCFVEPSSRMGWDLWNE